MLEDSASTIYWEIAGIMFSFASDAADAIAAVLRGSKPVAINVSLCYKEGHRVLVQLRAVAIRDGHGTVIGAAKVLRKA